MTATNCNNLQIYLCKNQAGGTYRSTNVKSRQVIRLCYPIDIMTATNWNNLQIYQCKNQAGGMFMLSNRHHDNYKFA